MLKLLRANFSRLWRTNTFWGAMALLALIGAAIPLKFLIDNRSGASAWTPDTACFTFAFLSPILLSLLAALFIGSEYSDGTMRNKCVAGHRRGSIYLANLRSAAGARQWGGSASGLRSAPSVWCGWSAAFRQC